MAIIKCPECGHVVSDRAKTCPNCGVDIAGQIVTCPDCGEVIFKDMAECPNCHCTINAAQASYEPVVTTAQLHQESKTDAAPADTRKPAPTRKRVKRSYTALVVSLVIALIIVLLGLYFYQTSQQQSELRAYENAIRSGEPAVLQNFLDIYADAPKMHRDSIQKHLDELKKIDIEWGNALASQSKTELQRYIDRHPGNLHVSEAKIIIDSIDWQTALIDSTASAFQLYLDEHPDGQHIDEARDLFERLEAMRLKPEEQEMLHSLFRDFFAALSQRSEPMLTTTLAPELSAFMSKEHATQADALTFMNSLYTADDIVSIAFIIADDWKIEKEQTTIDGQFAFSVSFSIDQRIDRSNQEMERFATYRVKARVNPAHHISAFNMQKVL